jgi:hypothetical protein
VSRITARKLGAVQLAFKFSTWLIRTVLNEALMKLRRTRTAQEESLDRNFQSDSEILLMDVAEFGRSLTDRKSLISDLFPFFDLPFRRYKRGTSCRYFASTPPRLAVRSSRF